MHEIIWRIVDNADFLEVQENFAKNIIVGFGRLNGRSVGIIANQPALPVTSLMILGPVIYI